MKGEVQVINEELLYIDPIKSAECTKIYLSESKSSWITIEWLSEELITYATENYQRLFNIHPLQRGKVVMNNEDIISPRWHRSYLHQPALGSTHKSSYMYSGSEGFDDLALPTPFQFFLDFLNEKEPVNKYNQVIVNWYQNGKDYTAPHSDCEKGMLTDAGITIITLCENENFPRELRITAKKLKTQKNDSLYPQIKIKLKHGCIITMHGETQKNFRHSVPKAVDNLTSRISLTFRKF
jgi:alkylated DNA repair dioxygenase AlkB